MFYIDEDKVMHLTRGDTAVLAVSANTGEGAYTFRVGDVVRITVTQKNDCTQVVLQKDVTLEADTTEVTMTLTGEQTKFDEVFSKPRDYWYEIGLNPEIQPQTILGYDQDGPKILRLYPEGGEV